MKWYTEVENSPEHHQYIEFRKKKKEKIEKKLLETLNKSLGLLELIIAFKRLSIAYTFITIGCPIKAYQFFFMCQVMYPWKKLIKDFLLYTKN